MGWISCTVGVWFYCGLGNFGLFYKNWAWHSFGRGLWAWQQWCVLSWQQWYILYFDLQIAKYGVGVLNILGVLITISVCVQGCTSLEGSGSWDGYIAMRFR